MSIESIQRTARPITLTVSHDDSPCSSTPRSDNACSGWMSCSRLFLCLLENLGPAGVQSRVGCSPCEKSASLQRKWRPSFASPQALSGRSQYLASCGGTCGLLEVDDAMLDEIITRGCPLPAFASDLPTIGTCLVIL